MGAASVHLKLSPDADAHAVHDQTMPPTGHDKDKSLMGHTATCMDGPRAHDHVYDG